MVKNTLIYIAMVQHQSEFPLPPSMQTVLPASLHSLAIQHDVYFSD